MLYSQILEVHCPWQFCRSLATDLRVEMQKRQQEEEGWYRQQQLLVEAEQARRNIIAEEEQKLADQRTRYTFTLHSLFKLSFNIFHLSQNL